MDFHEISKVFEQVYLIKIQSMHFTKRTHSHIEMIVKSDTPELLDYRVGTDGMPPAILFLVKVSTFVEHAPSYHVL